MSISEGDSVILSTQITGHPQPTVKWLKNGKPAPDLPTAVQNEMYTLTLIKPSASDSAKYTVIAENKLGTVQTSASLNVEGKIFRLFMTS